jgi:hypothetical protein
MEFPRGFIFQWDSGGKDEAPIGSNYTGHVIRPSAISADDIRVYIKHDINEF